jgi:hypothetical protein
VLKVSVSKEDLYAILARTVAHTRKELAMGHRTEGAAGTDAVSEVESALIELVEEAPPPRKSTRRIPQPTRPPPPPRSRA